MSGKEPGSKVEMYPKTYQTSDDEEVYILDSDSKLLINAGYQKLMSIKIAEPYTQDYLNEDQFRGAEGYTDEEIEDDKKYVKEFEAKFEKGQNQNYKEMKKKADILEYIIFEQGETGNWFGKLAHTIKTCKSDDIKNGIDLVVETQEYVGEGLEDSIDDKKLSYLGLAADITFERMDNALGMGKDIPQKFQTIINEINQGMLAEVKYYKSRLSGPKTLINIPRVVLNIDSKMANELIELWVNNKDNELANHKIHIVIIHQIVAQLAVYEEYAREVKRKKIAEKLKQVYEELEDVLMQKRKDFPQHAKFLNIEKMKEAYRAILKI